MPTVAALSQAPVTTYSARSFGGLIALDAGLQKAWYSSGSLYSNPVSMDPAIRVAR